MTGLSPKPPLLFAADWIIWTLRVALEFSARVEARSHHRYSPNADRRGVACPKLPRPRGAFRDTPRLHGHPQSPASARKHCLSRDRSASTPDGTEPGRARWFGLDNQEKVRSDWNEGRRLRGWVASTDAIDSVVSARRAIFGDKVSLPAANPTFDLAIPKDGSLPLDGAAPSIIDHRGDPTSMALIPDLGARLRSLTLEHPSSAAIETLYRELSIDHPPAIVRGPNVRYRAQIETPTGLKGLT